MCDESQEITGKKKNHHMDSSVGRLTKSGQTWQKKIPPGRVF